MDKESVNIRQRKDGSYEARIMIDGQRYSRYGKTASEAEKKLLKVQQELDRGKVIPKKVRLSIILQDYLENMKKGKVKATTYDRAESTFNHHIKNEPIGRMQLANIESEDIQKLLLNKCEEGLSESSIKKIYNLLSEFFRYVTAKRVVNYNPMELVTMPHSSNIQYQAKDMEVLTPEEMKRVIRVAEKIGKDGKPAYKYGEAIILLLVTGLRSGELRGINVRHIDVDSQLLYVCENVTYAKDRVNGGIKHSIGGVKTKNSRREVPLNERALLSIERLLETTCNKETGYLVCTSTGNIVTHSNLQRCYSLILKEAGVKHMGLHSTRHTFATIVLKDAEDKGQIKEVSELLGHSKVSTTYQYYIKTSNKDKKKLVNQLDKLVS